MIKAKIITNLREPKLGKCTWCGEDFHYIPINKSGVHTLFCNMDCRHSILKHCNFPEKNGYEGYVLYHAIGDKFNEQKLSCYENQSSM